MNVILCLLYFPGRMCGRAMCKRLSRCMPEPVIAAAAENGKKKRPAHIRLAGGRRAEAHAENGKKKRPAHIRLAGGRAKAHAENGKKRGRLTLDWLADVPKLTPRTVKKRGRLTLDWLVDVPKLTLRTVKKRPAQIRLAGGRAEAHAENGKKN